MIEILSECVKTYPNRPTLDPAEWPCTRDELEAEIDRAMSQLSLVMAPPAYPRMQGKQTMMTAQAAAGGRALRDAAAEMIAAGLAAMESIRALGDPLEACRPTRNQQLPGFRRPSWQRRA